MRTRILAVALCIALVFSVAACKKKEEQQPVPQTPGPMMPGPVQSMPPGQMPPGQMPPGQMPQMPPGQMGKPGVVMPKGKAQILVPDSVKGKWSGAKIIVEDKIAKTKQEYTVKLNSDFKLPNSNLKIHVGEFLPDFRMDGLNLTSGSNQPNNPALGIKVYENDKQIFPVPGKDWGWLFAKVPSIHAFEHQKYGIVLKEGVKKG